MINFSLTHLAVILLFGLHASVGISGVPKRLTHCNLLDPIFASDKYIDTDYKKLIFRAPSIVKDPEELAARFDLFSKRDMRTSYGQRDLPIQFQKTGFEKVFANFEAKVAARDYKAARVLLEEVQNIGDYPLQIKFFDINIGLLDVFFLNGVFDQRSNRLDIAYWFLNLRQEAGYQPYMNSARFFANADISNYLWLVDMLKQDRSPTTPARPRTNEVMVPGKIKMTLPDGSVYDFADPLPAALTHNKLFFEQLSKIREVVLKITLMAQWEEVFHYHDWLTYSQTGESVSPLLNKFLKSVGQKYTWWALHELAPAVVLGFERPDLMAEDSVEAQVFWTHYPDHRRGIFESEVFARFKTK